MVFHLDSEGSVYLPSFFRFEIVDLSEDPIVLPCLLVVDWNVILHQEVNLLQLSGKEMEQTQLVLERLDMRK